MPPKKNTKKNDDKSTKKENMASEKKNAEELPESEKKFYQAQIGDLEERLQRYQHKCDKLEIEAKDLHSKIDTVEKEKTDIVLYLKHRLTEKENELANLEETLSKHQQAQEAERDSFEMQLSVLRLELKEMNSKFTSENMTLAMKLASLEEFSAQREKLMDECKALEEKLQKEKEEHQAEIYSLEKKAVLYNDRLQKEMLEKVAAAAREFRQEMDQKMPETTIRAMRENLSVTVQFKHLSDRIEELMKENNSLRVKEKQLNIEYRTMEPLVHEITKKNITNQKVIQQLSEKCKQMQSELEKYHKLQTAHQRLLDNHTSVCTELNVLRQEHAEVTEELHQTKAELEKHRKDLEEERKLGERVKTVLHETAIVLKDTLREIPKKDDSEVQRNQMTQKLLAVLETAAAVGEGPALADFMPAMGYGHRPTSSSNPSHFKTGDLKLVPHKTHTISPKTGHFPKGIHTNLHK